MLSRVQGIGASVGALEVGAELGAVRVFQVASGVTAAAHGGFPIPHGCASTALDIVGITSEAERASRKRGAGVRTAKGLCKAIICIAGPTVDGATLFRRRARGMGWFGGNIRAQTLG